MTFALASQIYLLTNLAVLAGIAAYLIGCGIGWLSLILEPVIDVLLIDRKVTKTQKLVGQFLMTARFVGTAKA